MRIRIFDQKLSREQIHVVNFYLLLLIVENLSISDEKIIEILKSSGIKYEIEKAK